MKRVVLLVVIAIIIVGAVFALRLVRDEQEDQGGAIRVSGNIEATEVQLSFRIAGRVVRRLIDEGQTVASGQLAADLDTSELAQQVDQQKAAVDVAKAALAELEAGSRPEEIAASEAVVQRSQAALDELLAGTRPQEIAAQQAVVDRTVAELAFAESDYKRMQETVKTGAVGQTQFDNARTAYEAAQARLAEAQQRLKLLKEGPRKEQIEQARAALAESKNRFALVKKGPRQETIDQGRARLNEAQHALDLAKTRLSFAALTCPLSGFVVSKNVEAGEYVAAGTPVVTVADLQNIWLRAYVVGPDLAKVKLGQKVRVSTDSYQGKVYDGRVSFIASEAEFTPKSVQTNKERVKLVYRIKIDIQNTNMELKPGMPADAEILTGQ